MSNKINKYEKRGVLLLRNPIDAIISYRNYLSGGHKGMAGADRFAGSEWDAFVRTTCFSWTDHATRWIDGIKNGTVIFYENLIHETEAELKRIIPQFYSAPIDPDRLKCAIDHKNRIDRKRLQRTRYKFNVWFDCLLFQSTSLNLAA
jgi:hypothetical protein